MEYKISKDTYINKPFNYNNINFTKPFIENNRCISKINNKFIIETPYLKIHNISNNKSISNYKNISFLLSDNDDNIKFFNFLNDYYRYTLKYVYENINKWFGKNINYDDLELKQIKLWKVDNNDIILNFNVINELYIFIYEYRIDNRNKAESI